MAAEGVSIDAFARMVTKLSQSQVFLTPKERHWQEVNKKRQMMPDRRPIDPADKRIDENGVYNPFIKVEKTNEDIQIERLTEQGAMA